MQSNKVPELDKLFNEIGTYRKSNQFKELIEFIKKFPYIAPYNAMLIHIQKPGSQFVASASEWERRFNRTIKASAQPLVILRPFGPVAFVFELGDTYGKDLFPEDIVNPFKVEGKISEYEFKCLLSNLICDGILYDEVSHGTGSAGLIRNINGEYEDIIIRDKKTIIVKMVYELIVNKNHSQETKFATIVHELGHLFLGHLGSPHPKWWADRSFTNKNEREFEAECVCWLISERMGIKNPSAKYLSGYLDCNENIPRISIDSVLKSVGMIEAMMKSKKMPRKEIIIK